MSGVYSEESRNSIEIISSYFSQESATIHKAVTSCLHLFNASALKAEALFPNLSYFKLIAH